MAWKVSKKLASILQLVRTGQDILHQLMFIRVALEKIVERLGGDLVQENKKLREAIQSGTAGLDKIQTDIDKIGT